MSAEKKQPVAGNFRRILAQVRNQSFPIIISIIYDIIIMFIDTSASSGIPEIPKNGLLLHKSLINHLASDTLTFAVI